MASRATGDDREPYCVFGSDGDVAGPVSVFAGVGRVGGDTALVCGRPAAVAAVPGCSGYPVGPCVVNGGPEFQLLDPADGQAATADVAAAGGALVLAVADSAETGDRQADGRRQVCVVHGGTKRDGAASANCGRRRS